MFLEIKSLRTSYYAVYLYFTYYFFPIIKKTVIIVIFRLFILILYEAL